MSVTFVNVVDSAPERQQEVVDLLVEGTEQVVAKRPGFVSSMILAGADGTRVVSVATWTTAEAAAQTQVDPAAAGYAQSLAQLGTAAPGLFTVVAEFPRVP